MSASRARIPQLELLNLIPSLSMSRCATDLYPFLRANCQDVEDFFFKKKTTYY